MSNLVKRYVVAITGASGVIYGLDLLDKLSSLEDVECYCIISSGAKAVIEYEMNSEYDEVLKSFKLKPNIHFYDEGNFNAPMASGSFKFEAMIICPCSIKTLSKVSNAISDNLIIRSADVALKERRNLIIVPRETPLSTQHLKHMLNLSQMGALILPAMPAFYNQPKDVADVVSFITAKILNVLELEQKNLKQWGI